MDERGEDPIAGGEGALVPRCLRVPRDAALHALERGGRRPEEAREGHVPGGLREVDAARALIEVDEIVLVAVEADASEQARGRDALPERARDPEVGHPEHDLFVVAGGEGEIASRHRSVPILHQRRRSCFPSVRRPQEGRC